MYLNATVVSLRGGTMILQTESFHGLSGAAVQNEAGYLIGMVRHKLKDPDDGSSLALCEACIFVGEQADGAEGMAAVHKSTRPGDRGQN